MAADWRGIPGNEHVLKRLSAVVASGGTIGFVTAWSGLHRSSPPGGYATWRGTGSVNRVRDELFRPRARDLQ